MIFMYMLEGRLDVVEKVAINTSKNLLKLLQGFVRDCFCMQVTKFSLTTGLKTLTCCCICKERTPCLWYNKGKSSETMPFDEQQRDEGCWPWTS